MIVSKAKINFSIIRSLRLGASLEEAIETVAQIFHLPTEEVEACYQAVTDEEVCA